MAGIEVLDRTTYRVKMDFDGDGVMETKDVTLDDGVIFASEPIALAFDWRGRLGSPDDGDQNQYRYAVGRRGRRSTMG